MDLAALCDMWRGNDTNGHHLAVFSVNIALALALHFVAPHLPTYRSASGVGYASMIISSIIVVIGSPWSIQFLQLV